MTNDPNNIRFLPVQSFADLEQLNAEDIRDGYHAGRAGDPEPGHNHGRAYWHGWRNGMVDSGRMEKDAAMARLAHQTLPHLKTALGISR